MDQKLHENACDYCFLKAAKHFFRYCGYGKGIKSNKRKSDTEYLILHNIGHIIKRNVSMFLYM